MADLTRSVRGRKHPRNPGAVDLVAQFPSIDSYTKALLHFTGADGSTSFLDETLKVWTAVGNAQIDNAQFRFNSTSGLFDGTGDYLYPETSSDFIIGAGDFTIDFWIKYSSIGGGQMIYDYRPASVNGAYSTLYLNGTGNLVYYVNSAAVITGATVLVVNQWRHIAIVRSGTSTKLYLDGVQEGATYTDNNNYLGANNRPVIGTDGSTPGSFGHAGWIDEFRVSVGVARWTADFIPQGYPYGGTSRVDDSFTKALFHFNSPNGTLDFFDETGLIWRGYGGIQISTAQSKFGGASLKADGVNGGMWVTQNTDFIFGTGDFTVDFWVRFNVMPDGKILYDHRGGVQGAYPTIQVQTTKLQYMTNSSVVIQGTTVLVTGQWYHVALSRSGTSTRLFLNGTQEGSTYTDNSNYLCSSSRPFILNGYDGSYSIDGWVDELRISKGIARWTSNFTPPTAEY